MKITLLASLLLGTLPSNADVESKFQELNSKFLKISTKEKTKSRPSKIFPLQTWGMTWRPNLEITPSTEDICSSYNFKKKIFTFKDPEPLIINFWKNCENKWRANNFNPFTHSQEILRTDYEPSQHPEVRTITWTMKDETKLKGFLFYKGPIKKPLVFLRPGIFSHLRSSVAERFLMMMLFDEGPYHILFFPSTSGSDYVEDNHKIHFNDNIETNQTHEILNQLQKKEEPLNRFISKIHLVGISLGSYGLINANLIERNKSESLLDRSLFLCPAIDLVSSLNVIEDEWTKKIALKFWLNMRLSPLRSQLNLSPDDSIYNFIKLQLNHTNNNAISLFSNYNFTNTFFIWTQLDPILSPSINAQSLRKYQAPESILLELPRGLHCSLPTTYQWPLVSLTIRGYLDPQFIYNEKPIWSESISMNHTVKSIQIRSISIVNTFLKLQLLIQFKNPIFPVSKREILIPSHISQHAWALEDFNMELEKTIIRELSSRLDWSQETSSIKLSIF